MPSTHTIHGFRLAGDLSEGVLILEWPAAWLISVRRRLHDGPNCYVTSNRRLLLEMLGADRRAGPRIRWIVQPLMPVLLEVSM